MSTILINICTMTSLTLEYYRPTPYPVGQQPPPLDIDVGYDATGGKVFPPLDIDVGYDATGGKEGNEGNVEQMTPEQREDGERIVQDPGTSLC